jgi:chromate transport protein ChrA
VAGLADVVFGWLLLGQLLVLAAALVSVVLRLRRASGEERQQVKWFVYTVITVVLVFVTTTLILGAGYLFPIFGLIPISVAVAVFRYRLYDIDRLINRTLVYGLLTARFSGRLRDHVDLDTLATELLGVVDHTVQPASASLWLRRP